MSNRMRVTGGAYSPPCWYAGMKGEVYASGDNKRPIAITTEANASLIAAAPDMLAALEQSRDYVIPHALRVVFDAAIAKARGCP